MKWVIYALLFLISNALQANDINESMNAKELIAKCKATRKSNDEAFQRYYKMLKEISPTKLDEYDRAFINLIEGHNLYILGKYNESIKLLLTAKEPFYKVMDSMLIADLHIFLALDYYELNEFYNVLENSRLKDQYQPGAKDCYCGMDSKIYVELYMTEQAEANLAKEEKYWAGNKDKNDDEGWFKINKGMHFYQKKDFKQATQAFTEAVTYFKSLHHERGQGIAYYHLALIYRSSDPPLSKKYLDESMLFHKKSSNILYIILTNIEYGHYYKLIGKPEESISYFQMAYDIAKKSDIFKDLPICIENLIAFNKQKGNHKLVAQLTKELDHYNKINDRYESEKSIRIYETREKIESVKKQAKYLESSKLALRSYGTIIFVVLSILFITLIYLYTENKKTSRKVKLQLEQNTARKNQLADLEVKKQKFLSLDKQQREVLHELEVTYQQYRAKNFHFESILASIEDKKHKEKQIANPTEIFENFLKTVHPSLNSIEIEVCHMTKLGLSIKEMSSITLKSEGSIKVIKSRIKKKMKLDDNTKLENYLRSIQL